MRPLHQIAALTIVLLSVAAGSFYLRSPGAADPAIDSEEQIFLQLINAYRAQNGLGPLALNNPLNAAADWFSIDMATDNYFPADHIDNETPPRDPSQRAAAYGFTSGAGENITAGTFRDTGQEAFDAWKASPPHNTNMLRNTYNVIGIARAYNAGSQYKWYWTTDFGFIPGLTPAPTAAPTPVPTPPPTGAATPTIKPSTTPGPTETPGPTATPGPTPVQTAVMNLAGCTTNSLGASDDGSSPQVTLPFQVNFFGQTYGSLWVNNNGNVTFDSALATYTPFGLAGTDHVIIAPFFGDVDTQGSGSQAVTYGEITYGGRPGFCANWVNVGYFNDHTDKLNSFQLVVLDRGDVGPGDFDIIMNYDKVQWEAGDYSGGVNGIGGNPARMGYSNGSDVSFEYPGSNQTLAFLDSKPSGLTHNNRDAIVNGRYQFAVRNGTPPTGGSISGHVYAVNAAPENAIVNALVQMCGPVECTNSTTNGLGEYSVSGLVAGSYIVRVFPPAPSTLLPREIGPLNLTQNAALTNQDVILPQAVPPPPGTTITSRGTAGEIPLINWWDDLTLTTTGCAGGAATFIISSYGTTIRSGGMTEGPAGTYTATIASLYPNHGNATVIVTIDCPEGPDQTVPFDIYIDPSGVVQTTEGAPIAEAKVTLYRSDTAGGPFTQVPAGS